MAGTFARGTYLHRYPGGYQDLGHPGERVGVGACVLFDRGNALRSEYCGTFVAPCPHRPETVYVYWIGAVGESRFPFGAAEKIVRGGQGEERQFSLPRSRRIR